MDTVDRAALSEDLLAEFAGVYAEYRARLDEMVARAVGGWREVSTEGEWDGGKRARLEPVLALVHRITGSAGTFGYPAVSGAAAPLEILLRDMVEGTVAVDDTLRGHADRFVDHLAAVWARDRSRVSPLAALMGDVGPKAADSADGEDRRRVFLVDDDSQLAESLAHQVAQFGYEVSTFQTIEAAAEAARRTPPAAAIIDLMFPEGDTAGADLAFRLGGEVPAITVTSRTDFTARLAAVRAGCAAYLIKPVDIHDLIDWLDDLTGRRVEQRFRVLIVDDDTTLAETYALALKAAGLQPMVLAGPQHILEVLADVQPDLILMDIYMPDCTGIELARVVRQHRQYLGIPIVFLSVEGDMSRQLAALQPGGDDFLTKPIHPDHLVKAVVARAERARALRMVMETDSLTGLLNHARTKARLAAEVMRAARQKTALSFAIIDLDHFKKVNDVHGHLAGDRVLKALSHLLIRRLRRTDVIGRYGGEEFAVIFTDTEAAAAAEVLEGVRHAFEQVRHGERGREFHVTLSCGIAGFAGQSDSDSLIAKADAALYRAKAEGRNRVIRAGG
ncbi:MAG TPA: diguanylate cyclase [Azospirillaceae bacterium]|nr:diguanylate cyclase [Azospirillaceae bacterium]